MDPTASVEQLRRRILAPLRLEARVRRMLVSPHADLSFLPFLLLAPERETVYVDSGTTLGLLAGAPEEPGRGVLALGDPDYEAFAGTVSLPPLAATAKEVEAIGDVALVRGEATETGLREALEKRSRWRAVHLACHGIVDPGRPLASSLAVAPDATTDGRISVIDVFRMRVPADLVVLSACSTGLGRVYRVEGVVGFARAFMHAGARRVIVSLWNVDDEATRALMVKFYELWNPKDGSEGLPAATALKKAQEHVVHQEKWKHPCYWAAWQLWGLPD